LKKEIEKKQKELEDYKKVIENDLEKSLNDEIQIK